MDRRSLRKKNLYNNRDTTPNVTEPGKGGAGKRNRDTGDRQANLDNGGTYQAKEQFNASVPDSQDLQLNPELRTADYRTPPEEVAEEEGGIVQTVLPPAGIARPQFEDEEDENENDPDNPFFGNCQVCSGTLATNLECPSGQARITFGDGSFQDVFTPARIEYGGTVSFNYASGASGSIFTNSCGTPELTSDLGDLSPPIDSAVYGEMIYQQRATSVDIGGASGSQIKEFQIYKNECVVTIVGVADDGTSQQLGTTTCENVDGTYTPFEETFCINVGGHKECGIDPDSLSYQCTVRISEFCTSYNVKWVKQSTGEELFVEECSPVAYQITSEENRDTYKPGPRNEGTGFLVYDSGDPRTFSVNGGESSGDFGYFQIYRDTDDPCAYEVVGVKVTGDKGTFSGAVNTKTYQTFYSGGCGFEVDMTGFANVNYLQIIGADGGVILETTDFNIDSVDGCLVESNSPLTIDQTSNFCRSVEQKLVGRSEKSAPAEDPSAVTVIGLECL